MLRQKKGEVETGVAFSPVNRVHAPPNVPCLKWMRIELACPADKSICDASCVEQFQGPRQQGAGPRNRFNSSLLKHHNASTCPGDLRGGGKSGRASTNNYHVKVCHFCIPVSNGFPMQSWRPYHSRRSAFRLEEGMVGRLAELIIGLVASGEP